MTPSTHSADRGKSNYDDSATVLVVGAGPTGLLLASELHRHGIPCHLIDARPAPLHWDRATVVRPRSLQIFESMGLADRFLDIGRRQRKIKIHSDGMALGTLDLAGCGSIYGFNLGLSEEVTENILTDHLQRYGGEVHRASRLLGLTLQHEGAIAEIDRDGSRYEMQVRWVVGCDGLHSTTRKQCGIHMEGHAIARPWAVFDVTLKDWAETHEATFVYLDTPPVILTSLPDNRWRVYLRPSSEDSDLLADAAETLSVYAPAASFVDVENPTRFHCHTQVATRFRAGAVLLAGDAAHICSPAEGHGMNRGLQDAFNLAWKLALVSKGADPALLDTYEAERRPAAQMVAQSGDNAERNLTMTDPVERSNRNQAIRQMFTDKQARHHEIVAEAELNVDYSGSPIVIGDKRVAPGKGTQGDGVEGLAAGSRIADTIEVQPADRAACRLVELTHRLGHTLLLLGGKDADRKEFLNLEAALRKFVGAARVPRPGFTQQESSVLDLFEAAFALAMQPDKHAANIGELGQEEADLLGVNGITLLAVRPDGYVGLRADDDHLGALERYRSLVVHGWNSGSESEG